MITTLLLHFFDDPRSSRREGSDGHPLKENHHNVIIPAKYAEDVEKLKDYIGEARFVSGLCIDVSLQELLEVVPRQRKRSDSYKTLISFLKDELNINLTIKTRRKNTEKYVNGSN